MSWRLDNRRRFILLMLAVCALLLQAVLDATRAPVQQRDYELKLAAAQKAEQAFAAVRAYRHLDGARLDLVNDPAGTGLVGPEFSLITNARGDLNAKLTSLNPNFAGLIVQYFREAGLRKGDQVAVAVSGSFPGINIGLYAAMETLGLEPVIITSVGASMWGANSPDFTWLDMEKLFAEAGIFHLRSQAATFGGGNDMGRGLSPAGRDLLQKAIDRSGVPLLTSDNIQESIARRQAFYLEHAQGRPIKAYVNVGGGVASIGSSHNRLLLPGGLSFNLDAHNWPRKGNLILFAEAGVPIIHLLGISDLARSHGLPVTPDYLPQAGEGEIFVRTMYRFPVAAAVLVIYSLLCVLVLAPEIRQGLFDRLTRRRPGAVNGALPLLAVILAAAAVTVPAQAATRWVGLAPVPGTTEICLRGDGQDFSYQLLQEEQPTGYRTNGPRGLKIIARYVFGAGEKGGASFTLVAALDGQETLRKTFRTTANKGLVLCSGKDAVSALRRAYLEAGKGPHELQLWAICEGTGRVAVRVFEETRRQSPQTVSCEPSQFTGLATLQFESGAQSTYYRFEADRPLVFSLTGPASAQLYTRLDFDLTMNGIQEYTIEVVRDGVPWRTFQFHTGELGSAQYVEFPDVRPGSRKKSMLEVPPGPHTFEVRCLRPAACGIAAQVLLPLKALEVRP